MTFVHNLFLVILLIIGEIGNSVARHSTQHKNESKVSI